MLFLLVYFLGLKITDNLVPYDSNQVLYENFELPNINDFEG